MKPENTEVSSSYRWRLVRSVDPDGNYLPDQMEFGGTEAQPARIIITPTHIILPLEETLMQLSPEQVTDYLEALDEAQTAGQIMLSRN